MRFSFVIAVMLVCITYVLELVFSEESSEVSGRFVEFNPAIPLGFGLQITVPLSFFIPKLGYFDYRRRSLGYHDLAASPLYFRKRQMQQSMCPSQVATLEDYLQLLYIDTESCQKRFICEVASNPGMFQPLSDILLKKLPLSYKSGKENRIRSTSNYTYLHTSHRLERAATIGVKSLGRQCHSTFSECPFAAESMVNVGLLGWWKLLSTLFNVHVFGETDGNSQ